MKQWLVFIRFAGAFALASAAGWWGAGRWADVEEKSGAFSGRKTLPPSAAASAGTRPGDPDRWLAAVAGAGGPAAQCRAAVDLAAALQPGDFARMIDRADKLPGKTAQELFVLTLLHRWIAVDPEAALRWCEIKGQSHLERAVADWTERDPKAAEAYLSRCSAGRDPSLAGAFFQTLARRDPAAAYAALAAPHTWNETLLHQGLRTLAEADPQRLLEAAETHRPRIFARIAVAEALAKRDPAGAMAWIGQQPDRKILARRAIAAMPDVHSGLEAWKALPGALAADSLSYLSWRLSVRDPAGTLAALEPLGLLGPDSRGRDFASASLTELARRDPQEAIRLLGTLNLPQGWRAQQTVALEWSRTDPVAALEWARTFPEGRIDPNALAQLTSRAAAPEWDASPVGRYFAMAQRGDVEYSDLRALTTPEQRAEALDALARPKALPDESWRAGAEQPIQEMFPADYAAWLLRRPPDPQREEKIAATVLSWTHDDPRAAAAWVIDRLPAAEQPPAINGLLSAWKDVDSDGAKAWFRALPEDVRKDVKAPGRDW